MRIYDRSMRRPVWRLHNCRYSSERAGNCQCCGKPVSEIHLLTEMQTYKLEDGRETLKCLRGKFGHRDCLSMLTH